MVYSNHSWNYLHRCIKLSCSTIKRTFNFYCLALKIQTYKKPEQVRIWYLEEEWTLVLSLRTSWPETVGEWAGFSRGDKVAEGQRLLQKVRNLFMRLHTVRTLALQWGIKSRFSFFTPMCHMLCWMSLDSLHNQSSWYFYVLTVNNIQKNRDT